MDDDKILYLYLVQVIYTNLNMKLMTSEITEYYQRSIPRNCNSVVDTICFINFHYSNKLRFKN